MTLDSPVTVDREAIPLGLREEIIQALCMDGGNVMEGWTLPERGIEMAELIVRYRPRTCVEIGVFGGRSLLAQAMALRYNGYGRIYGIDPWKKDIAIEGEAVPENVDWWSKVDLHDIHRKAMEALWRYKLEEWAVVIRAASHHVPILFAGGINWLHIDGCHSEAASCRDVRLYAPMLAPEALVVMDDTDWISTRPAQGIILEYCDLIKDSVTHKLYKRK